MRSRGLWRAIRQDIVRLQKKARASLPKARAFLRRIFDRGLPEPHRLTGDATRHGRVTPAPVVAQRARMHRLRLGQRPQLQVYWRDPFASAVLGGMSRRQSLSPSSDRGRKLVFPCSLGKNREIRQIRCPIGRSCPCNALNLSHFVPKFPVIPNRELPTVEQGISAPPSWENQLGTPGQTGLPLRGFEPEAYCCVGSLAQLQELSAGGKPVWSPNSVHKRPSDQLCQCVKSVREKCWGGRGSSSCRAIPPSNPALKR